MLYVSADVFFFWSVKNILNFLHTLLAQLLTRCTSSNFDSLYANYNIINDS